MSHRFPSIVFALCSLLLLFFFSDLKSGFCASDDRSYPRLSGEFEPQRAILLSVSDWQPHHRHILIEIAQKTRGYVALVILHNDSSQKKQTIAWLNQTGEEFSHVSFFQMPLDTIWLRDFAPRMAETQNGSVSIDFFYNGVRPKDDAMPQNWAKVVGVQLNSIRWTMQGGNLLSNGQGTVLTTSRIFKDNYITFPRTYPLKNADDERRKIVREAFTKGCNIRNLVVLEPLQYENTKHVDMFCTFLAEDLAVVASVDARRDPVNARILDANARRLSQLQVNGKPMRVERIPVPVRRGIYWSPYTNIILANKLLLMPRYKGDSPALLAKAKAVYQRLLPEHTIETIDMTSMAKLEGALHCLSVNIPQFANLPSTRQIDGGLALQVPSKGSTSQPQSGVGKKRQLASNENQTRQLSKSNPPEESNDVSAKQASQDLDRQRAVAVHSYLRRFESTDGLYSAKAYAIEVRKDSVSLLVQDSNRIVNIGMAQLRRVDQLWLQHHSEKINRNGAKVKTFVLRTSKANSTTSAN